jgi:hypothetical protein
MGPSREAIESVRFPLRGTRGIAHWARELSQRDWARPADEFDAIWAREGEYPYIKGRFGWNPTMMRRWH